MDHLQAARAATREQRELESRAAQYGMSVEDYLRATGQWPTDEDGMAYINLKMSKLARIEADHTQAAQRATELQRSMEDEADEAGMTVAEYMHSTGQWPMSKGE